MEEKEINKKVINSHVKVYGGGVLKHASEIVDKRPKKENEMNFSTERNYDIDYEKYGYTKPDKIKPGHFTLRQFDEMINEFKQAKRVATSPDNIELIEESLSKKYNLDKSTLKILTHYYKPFDVVGSKEKVEQTPIGKIFPNVNKDEAVIDK